MILIHPPAPKIFGPVARKKKPSSKFHPRLFLAGFPGIIARSLGRFRRDWGNLAYIYRFPIDAQYGVLRRAVCFSEICSTNLRGM